MRIGTAENCDVSVLKVGCDGKSTKAATEISEKDARSKFIRHQADDHSLRSAGR
jgi:hypothetical protein